jgi:23S rRNA pseudouridine2605 synthase
MADSKQSSDAAVTIRLQKYLSERGVASRRAAAEWIRAGRIAVNGRVTTEPGLRVTPGSDAISLDGRPLAADRPVCRTIMLNKPRGYVCSRSTREGKSVLELLPDVTEHLVPVGRLDRDSEGLLLLSNDGDLTLRVTHPRFGHVKSYRATVSGPVGEKTLAFLRSPMRLEDGPIRPAEVRALRPGSQAGRQVLEFVLREGRNRQIRRMCEKAGLEVHRLVRVQVGPLELGGLRPGQWRDLTSVEVEALRAGGAVNGGAAGQGAGPG